MKTKVLLSGALVLCLSSCATQPVNVDARATDLELLRLGVRTLTQPRAIPGDVKRAEDAETNGQLMDFATDAEETVELSEGDKAKVRTFVEDAVLVIDRGRAKLCAWYQFSCKASNRRRALAPTPGATP